ncbi:MAG: hypothetical protein J7M39_13490 [Anaerolineae bacterium]|nr:hypothetical protein [Anaerolineae bacterium]
MSEQPRQSQDRGEALIAILNNPNDLAILQHQRWYRIPVRTAPKRWPPKLLAFYQTRIFGDEAYAVRYYGSVREIREVGRAELFPHEAPNAKSDKRYYQILLDNLNTLAQPIISRRWRRIVFIPTTIEKFWPPEPYPPIDINNIVMCEAPEEYQIDSRSSHQEVP